MNQAIRILFFLLCFPCVLLSEPKDNNPENLKIAQETVKVAAGDIQVKLDTIIQEMKKNGLADMDEATLHQTLAALGSLTESEMQTVISSLKQASSASDTRAQTKKLTEAYVAQGKISDELTHMAASFQQAQILGAISAQIRNLIRHQLEAARDTQAQLVKSTNEGFLIVDNEQKNISRDISNLPSLFSSNADVPEEAKGILKEATDYLSSSGLDAEGKKAAQQVTAKKMDQAQPSQQKIVEILGVLLEKVSKIDQLMERLQQAKDQLETMIRDESDMAQRSDKGQENKADAERQTNIEDNVAITRQELKQISPEATTKLDEAEKNIQKSEEALKKQPDGKTASQPQKDATEALKQAEKEIDKQLTQLAALEQKSDADKLKDIQALADETQKAADEEKELAQKPDSSKQQDLEKQTEKLQQDALPIDQKASDMLSKASAQMEQKQPDAATQAADTLQKAADELKQQAQEMAQEEQNDKTDQQLSQMEQDLQKMDASLEQNKDQQQSAQQLQAMAQQMGQMEQQQANGDMKQQMQQAEKGLNQAAKEAPQNGPEAAQTNQQTIQQMQQMQAAMAAMATKGPYSKSFIHNSMRSSGGGSAIGDSGKMQGSGPNMLTSGMVVGTLKPKDRDAMSTYENDKIPQGYESMVKQYRQNLAEPAE